MCLAPLLEKWGSPTMVGPYNQLKLDDILSQPLKTFLFHKIFILLKKKKEKNSKGIDYAPIRFLLIPILILFILKEG